MIYPDLQFVTSVLVFGEHSAQAAELLRKAPHPIGLSLIHRLQVENAFLRLLRGSNQRQAKIARDGLRCWSHYLAEEVFVIRKFDLEEGFAKASAWNAANPLLPPKWSLLLHPAIAATVGAAFMSFDPALRKAASTAGLKLLPERL